MPQVEGRGIRAPRFAEVYMGDLLVLRFDDEKNPIFWFTVAFTPKEFGEMFDRYCDWLQKSGQADALRALVSKAE